MAIARATARRSAIWRIERAHAQPLVRRQAGQLVGRDEEHIIGHLTGLGDDRAKPDPREDEDVVRLTDHPYPCGAVDLATWAAGGDQGSSSRPGEDVFRPCLGTVARVRQWKHDRHRVVEGHFSDEGLGERARAGRRADQDGRTA